MIITVNTARLSTTHVHRLNSSLMTPRLLKLLIAAEVPGSSIIKFARVTCAVLEAPEANEMANANITGMEARVTWIGEEGNASKHKAKILALRLVDREAEGKPPAMYMTKLKRKASLENEAEGLGLGLVQANGRAEKCVQGEAKRHEGAICLRARVLEVELGIGAIAIRGDIVDDDGEATGTRPAVLKGPLRETNATGARLAEYLSGARAALRSTKRKPRGACEALRAYS